MESVKLPSTPSTPLRTSTLRAGKTSAIRNAASRRGRQTSQAARPFREPVASADRQNSKLLSDPIEIRLRRIEGQIKGIRRMYREGRDCMALAQQIAAVRSALVGVGREVVSGEAIRCAGSRTRQKEFAKMIEELFVMR